MSEPARAAAAPEPDAAPLMEGRDYTVDGRGRWVFTAEYLRSRGYCCFQACRHCPWGQQGRTPAQAFADLQARLDRVERRLQTAGMDVELTGYRLGVLRARPPRSACATDLAGLGRHVQAVAAPDLTVSGIAWE